MGMKLSGACSASIPSLPVQAEQRISGLCRAPWAASSVLVCAVSLTVASSFESFGNLLGKPFLH
jgi:hypothetical protein